MRACLVVDSLCRHNTCHIMSAPESSSSKADNEKTRINWKASDLLPVVTYMSGFTGLYLAVPAGGKTKWLATHKEKIYKDWSAVWQKRNMNKSAVEAVSNDMT